MLVPEKPYLHDSEMRQELRHPCVGQIHVLAGEMRTFVCCVSLSDVISITHSGDRHHV